LQLSEAPLTEWLRLAGLGDRKALDRVFEAIYPDLRRLARSRLRAHTGFTLLDTTGLVHECFVRLVEGAHLPVENRGHFFAYAAAAMRTIIVDMARQRLALRRGGHSPTLRLDSTLLEEVRAPDGAETLLRINDALLALEATDAALARIVEMRYFAGYSEAEIAELTFQSGRSVRRQWDKARAFLYLQLKG
jgi:RNA polymerase sigma factor (TIGR02999 family)